MARSQATAEATQNAAIPIEKVPRQRVAEYIEIYSNSANVVAGYYDVGIVFSELQVGAPSGPIILEKSRVTMNPAHAKALILALKNSVERWERSFGEIKLPPGLIKFQPDTK